MTDTHFNPGPMVLASLLTGYPGEAFGTSVHELLQDEKIDLPEDLRRRIQACIATAEAVNDLRSEYISIFEHSKTLNPLYETEYGRQRAMFKANELADIAGFYRAFGFELDPSGDRDMVDHISVELEFYSLLQMKLWYLKEQGDAEGAAIVLDGMRKFMEAHLGRFVPAIRERSGVAGSPTYSGLYAWLEELISLECRRLEVKPGRSAWFDSQGETENICCGGGIALNNKG